MTTPETIFEPKAPALLDAGPIPPVRLRARHNARERQELWAALVFLSPWVLGFQGTTAMTVHVVIGAAVAILAVIELWMMSQIPPRLTTGR